MRSKYYLLVIIPILLMLGTLLNTDFLNLLTWWIYILAIGLTFLPLSSKIFDNFYDKGYIFSKTIGILVLSYTFWLLSSIKVLPFYRIVLILIFALYIGILLIYKQGYKRLFEILKQNEGLIVLEEGLFLIGLIFWSYIRGINPQLHDLEKFMDFGFVNSTLRSTFMPPADMWQAGSPINYYYWGHYVTAFLTKLSNIESAVTYNLMIATLFSFTFVLAFSLCYNLCKHFFKDKKIIPYIGGTVSGLLLVFGGNLHTVIFAYVMPYLKKIGVYKGQVNPYWYPDATRYIGYNPETHDKTIHEFPHYSFVVSDLHAHVLNIPFVLTALAILFALILKLSLNKEDFKKNSENQRRIDFPKIILSLLIAEFYMGNFWDFPIYLTVTLFTFLYLNLVCYDFSLKSIWKCLLDWYEIFIVSLAFASPFLIAFKNFSQGVSLVHSHTPLYQFMVLWGYQLFFVACFFILILTTNKVKKEKTKLVQKFKNYIMNINSVDIFIIILSISCIGLIIIPEIVYVKDIYGGDYYRANTMFKITYQAFIMFTFIAGYTLTRFLALWKKGIGMKILNITLLLIIALPLMFPFKAIPGYYPDIKTPVNAGSDYVKYKGLDGLKFLEKLYPNNYAAINWLNSNVTDQPVILEAFGDSYTDYSQISMATGLPTIQGWVVHEWLWRGSYDKVAERQGEVTEVYESKDNAKVRAILDKYKVQYVIIGKFEREKFKNINEPNLLGLGPTVFEQGDIKIVKVNR